MNFELVKHGILNERSTYRVHVSFTNWQTYLFETQEGKTLAENVRYTTKEIFSPIYELGGERIKTAIGTLGPWEDFSSLIITDIPPEWKNIYWVPNEYKFTREKGQNSKRIIFRMINLGILVVPQKFEIINIKSTNLEDELSGIDLIKQTEVFIQVKCDYKSGPKPKGTGHIFLQTKECNPNKII